MPPEACSPSSSSATRPPFRSVCRTSSLTRTASVVTRVAVTKPKRFGRAPGLTLPVASSVSDTSSSPDHPRRGQLITHVPTWRPFLLYLHFTESSHLPQAAPDRPFVRDTPHNFDVCDKSPSA